MGALLLPLLSALLLVAGVAACTASAPTRLGSLRIRTDPALPAQISLNGEVADLWGVNWVKLPPGFYVVHFSHVEGFTEPDDQKVSVGSEAITTLVGTFVQRGSLRVTTSPALPGQISVDGIPRNNWGLWTDFPAGARQVCFGPVAGYDPPPCQTVNVNAGATATVTGTYTANRSAPGASGMGLLRVTTDPALASQISVNGEIADSWGLNWLQLPPGSYTVHFSHVEGFTDPPDQTIVVGAGAAATTIVGTFVQRGSLRVVTSPAVAGTVSVDGLARDDWGLWADAPTGSHTVCFGDVSGFTTPACQDVTVNPGSLTTVTGTYK